MAQTDATRYSDALSTLLTLGARDVQDLGLEDAVARLELHAAELLSTVLHERLAKLAGEARARADGGHTCWVDDQPCEVMAPLAQHLPEGWGTGWQRVLEAVLPCCWCRAVDKGAASLPGVRLGRVERRLLRTAQPAAPDYAVDAYLIPGCFVGTTPTHGEHPSPAERVAASRARGKLLGLFLVWSTHLPRKRVVRRNGWDYEMGGGLPGCRLSPLGQEVVTRYRRELEENRPIRWDGRLKEAHDAARKKLPDLLRLLVRHAGKAADRAALPPEPPRTYFDEDASAAAALIAAVKKAFPDLFANE